MSGYSYFSTTLRKKGENVEYGLSWFLTQPISGARSKDIVSYTQGLQGLQLRTQFAPFVSQAVFSNDSGSIVMVFELGNGK